MAAPVVDSSGRCHAALSVAGPFFRLPQGRLVEIAPLCIESARQIGSRLLGATPAAAEEASRD